MNKKLGGLLTNLGGRLINTHLNYSNNNSVRPTVLLYLSFGSCWHWTFRQPTHFGNSLVSGSLLDTNWRHSRPRKRGWRVWCGFDRTGWTLSFWRWKGCRSCQRKVSGFSLPLGFFWGRPMAQRECSSKWGHCCSSSRRCRSSESDGEKSLLTWKFKNVIKNLDGQVLYQMFDQVK